MKRLTIYNKKFAKNEHSLLEVYIDDRGDLIFEGLDSGESIKEYWGDFDYEYWLKIKNTHLNSLLLHLIKECFDRSLFQTDSNFKVWLQKVGIPSEFNSYV